MRERTIEIAVGLFMMVGFAALLFLALKVSGLSPHLRSNAYTVSADFDNIGNLKVRAPVKIAGVRIGEVKSIDFNNDHYTAKVTMSIDENISAIPSDTSASILTAGLLGANYISLTPGFENDRLKNNDQLESTHSALILEDLIGQLLFSLKNDDEKNTAKE